MHIKTGKQEKKIKFSYSKHKLNISTQNNSSKIQDIHSINFNNITSRHNQLQEWFTFSHGTHKLGFYTNFTKLKSTFNLSPRTLKDEALAYFNSFSWLKPKNQNRTHPLIQLKTKNQSKKWVEIAYEVPKMRRGSKPSPAATHLAGKWRTRKEKGSGTKKPSRGRWETAMGQAISKIIIDSSQTLHESTNKKEEKRKGKLT